MDSDSETEYIRSLDATRAALEAIDKTQNLYPNENGVPKIPQTVLVLVDFKQHDPKWFCSNLRVSPETFDSLLEIIKQNPVFQNQSNKAQAPVNVQLAIALYRFGHFENAASVEKVAQWAGVSEGTVVNCTCRVCIAFLALHDQAVHWPNEDEKEKAKEWVKKVSCQEWRDGFCMVDGTLIPLFEKPGHHGEAYFDQKSNYLLNVQVSIIYFNMLVLF
jgi:hypothetical protein